MYCIFFLNPFYEDIHPNVSSRGIVKDEISFEKKREIR